MQTEKELTGYPHIDKPWEQYYPKNDYEMYSEQASITKYLKDKNKGKRNLVAETYYGKEYTYEELFEKVDTASRVLAALGVTEGSTVMNLMPNIPETGQIWLGAAQIGAISDFIDPRPDSMDIKANADKVLELLRTEKANYIVALDKCYTYMLKPIENEIKDLGIDNIIIVSPSDSMTVLGMINYFKDVVMYNKLKNQKIKSEAIKKLKFYEAISAKIKSMRIDNERCEDAIKSSPLQILRYRDLIKDVRYQRYDEINDLDLVSYIGHTSGTSGARPKPIPLTNRNQIFSSESIIKTECNVDEVDIVLHELPFFSPLGADNNFIVDLASNSNLIDIPEFEINEFGYLLKKAKMNNIMGTPSWLLSLMECAYLKKRDLQSLKRVIYGGDSMSESNEKKLIDWLEKMGSNAQVQKGHGMSEYCGGGTYARDEWNVLDSMGIPLSGVIYAIVDPNIDDKLVPVKEKDSKGFIHGELAVSADSVTPGVLNGETIVKRYTMDGKEYIRTRDLVKMREDGVFFFENRKDRSFTRFDGYKIKPSEIEKEIELCPNVISCIIVPYLDTNKHGLMPIAHIVSNNDDEFSQVQSIEMIREIVDKYIVANPNMSSRQIPSKFKIRKSIPLTKNSKIDFNRLISEGIVGNEINVDVDETNLSVGNIEIYVSNKKS